MYGTYKGRRRVPRPKFDLTEEYFAGLLSNVETDCVRKKKERDIIKSNEYEDNNYPYNALLAIIVDIAI